MKYLPLILMLLCGCGHKCTQLLFPKLKYEKCETEKNGKKYLFYCFSEEEFKKWQGQ